MLPDRHGCRLLIVSPREFQWAPTLEGECYALTMRASFGVTPTSTGFNGHPPLGVNATLVLCANWYEDSWFQWAPTLGGECYRSMRYGWSRRASSFNGHPPLGVNATFRSVGSRSLHWQLVSMGTHPWG